MGAERKKVLIAMSGGVDSSVTAALLVQAGYECVGATMQLWPESLPMPQENEGGCCSLSAVEDARRVANQLGIPYYVLNMQKEFERYVVKDFAEQYKAGRTPNPCIVCNRKVKFETFLEKARQLGMDYVATGHYARISYDEELQRYIMKKGIDPGKDQSYALYNLTQSQLKHTLMPLGTYTKAQTRQIAKELNLQTASKAESQEICFIPDNDYHRFLRDYTPEVQDPGEVVNTKGEVLGFHSGIAFYTVGQRRGLGISGPEPYYVVRVEPESNRVVVGTKEEVYSNSCELTKLNWLSIPSLEPGVTLKAEVKIRYNAPAVPAKARLIESDRLRIDFEKPQRAVTPGQAGVLYQGNLVLGGGTITGTG